MGYYWASNQNNLTAALANGSIVAQLTPAAAVNFHIISLVLGCNTAGVAISDFDISVGLNYGTARGTVTTTATSFKSDPNNTVASGITGLDVVVSAQPTLAATDAQLWSFNSRGTLTLNFNPWDITSNIGTTAPICFVNRSGAALPASHAVTLTAHWLE
jgi:hypothetical protein